MIEGPRPVRPSEYDSMLKLINDTLFAGNDTTGMEKVYPGHLARSNYSNLWVMVEDGKVVSHAGFSRLSVSVLGAKLAVVLMGSVCTRRKYRGLGLASRIIDHTRRRHDRQGYDVYMISGDLPLYRRFGASRAGRLVRYVLSRSALKPFAHPDVTVRQAEAGDLREIASLYSRERLHLNRTMGIYRWIFRNGWAWFRPSKFYVAEADGRITAYFVAAVTGKAGGPPRGSRLTVIEAAGSRTDLMAALYATCRKWNKNRIDLAVSMTDRDTLSMLSGRNLSEIRDPVYPLTMILNIGRLVQRLRPLLVRRAGRAAARLTGGERAGMMELRLGSRRLALKPEAMTRLVFGEPQRDHPAGIRASGELGRVIRRAFPVPLVNPGINYM